MKFKTQPSFGDLEFPSHLTFFDISNESMREYNFANGDSVEILNPIALHVSASGGHRIVFWTPNSSRLEFAISEHEPKEGWVQCAYIQPKENWYINWNLRDESKPFVGVVVDRPVGVDGIEH